MTNPSPPRRPPAESTGAAGGPAARLPADATAELRADAPQPATEPATETGSRNDPQPCTAEASRQPPAAATGAPPSCRPSRWPRRLRVAALGAGLVVLGGGGALALWGHPTAPVPVEVGVIPAANAAGPAIPATPAAPTSPDTAPAVPSAVTPPIRLQIPDIKVDTPLSPLGLQADGTVAVPTNFAHAGWYDGGARPGDPGPAVVLGHVDSYRGPAVFYRLRQLRPGNVVVIGRLDGSTVSFAVDAVREFAKNRFPTDLVYGDTAAPTLRLITCGGSFDRRTRSYLDNAVVFAHEVFDDRDAHAPVTAPTSSHTAAPPATLE